ncbi:MAG: polysaccharide biosynthesis C-terminal domain-containing protein, partial [Bdellovibrionales bacterium]|nr:polysaccharide biosynthesis C-terminal domain-containing protein [Bdellovibrionales bacterium]
LYLGGGLIGLALSTLASRGIQLYLLLRFTKKQLPFLRLSFSLSNRRDLKQVAHYGLGVCLIAVATRAIAHIDTLVVGISLTPKDVAVYGVTLLVIDYFRLLLQSSGTVLTPRLSSLHAEKDDETTRTLLLKWIRYSHLLSVGVGVPLLICGKDFLLLWVGKEYSDSGVLLQMLTLPFFFTVPALVFHNYLLAHAKHYLSAKLLLLEAMTNIILSLYLVKQFGMVGVALGTIIPSVIFSATLLPVIVCQMTDISILKYLWESVGKLIPLFALHFAVVWSLSQYFGSETWALFITHSFLSLLIFLLWCFFFLLSSDDRRYIQRRVRLNSSHFQEK